MEGGEHMEQKIEALYMEHVGYADSNRYDEQATKTLDELMGLIRSLTCEDSEVYRAIEFKISLLMASCEYSGFASAVEMMEK